MQLTVHETPSEAIERVKAKIHVRARYENFIGGKWVPPVKGQYFENTTPINGQVVCEVARSNAADIELALDAAHEAKDAWGKHLAGRARRASSTRSPTAWRSNLEMLALAETWDNGKPIRETMAADIPLAIDHFRYFAGCVRAQEGSICEIDDDTVAYHFHEPLGVVGQIIPWNFPHPDGGAGSWPRRSPPATASCSSPPSRRRFASWS